MSAQQNYNTDLGQLQRYYQQGLMNSDDIAIFDEAKSLRPNLIAYVQASAKNLP